MKGCLTLPASFLDWVWYKDPGTTRLMIHMMLLAAKTGETTVNLSIREAARLTGLRISDIRRIYKDLVASGDIELLEREGNNRPIVLKRLQNDTYTPMGAECQKVSKRGCPAGKKSTKDCTPLQSDNKKIKAGERTRINRKNENLHTFSDDQISDIEQDADVINRKGTHKEKEKKEKRKSDKEKVAKRNIEKEINKEKEKENSSYLSHAREAVGKKPFDAEGFLSEFFSSSHALQLESLERNFGRSVAELREMAVSVIHEWQLTGECDDGRDYKTASRHLINTLRIISRSSVSLGNRGKSQGGGAVQSRRDREMEMMQQAVMNMKMASGGL